jgi:hypothetical protein
MSTPYQNSNFLDIKTFFTDGDVKNIVDLISDYVIKDTVENKITLTNTNVNKNLHRIWWDKDIREYIHNSVLDKLHSNKSFFSNQEFILIN